MFKNLTIPHFFDGVLLKRIISARPSILAHEFNIITVKNVTVKVFYYKYFHGHKQHITYYANLHFKYEINSL